MFQYASTADKKEFSLTPSKGLPKAVVSLRFGFLKPDHKVGGENAQFYLLENVEEEIDSDNRSQWTLL